MKIAFIAALLLLATGLSALALDRDGRYASSPHAAWFKSQHNSQGQWCCDESDGHPFYGDYTINADGSITLEQDGAPRTIPAFMVLKGPNPTGHSVWWYIETGGQHRDYCFAPGTLG